MSLNFNISTPKWLTIQKFTHKILILSGYTVFFEMFSDIKK
jgi:hypothetical protein